MDKIFFSITVTMLFFNISSTAQDSLKISTQADGHTSICVLEEHDHKKGEFMFSYRYKKMSMNGNLNNSDDISNDAIFQNYLIAPEEMTMDMQMYGLMYGLTDKITLMLMGSYISNSMDLSTKTGVDFTTKSSGFGDISISGKLEVLNKNRQSLHAHIGLSVPIGNINQRDDTPMLKDATLAYPMQLGSGTYDPFFGTTYSGHSNRFSWGLEAFYKLRTGQNSKGYSLGNRFDASAWGSIKVLDYLSFSAGLSYFDQRAIDGADAELNTMMMPLFSTTNSGGNQLNFKVKSNFAIPSNKFKNIKLTAEFETPLSQNLNGVQMKNEWIGTLGIQYTIGHKH